MRELIEGVTKIRHIGNNYHKGIARKGLLTLVDAESCPTWTTSSGEELQWGVRDGEGQYWEFVDDSVPTTNLEHKTLPSENEWTDKHYNFNYQLKPIDIEKGFVKLDAYLVNKIWRLNAADSTGAAFHCLKTLTRLANEKNSKEREIRALYGQVKRWAEIEGIEL